MIRCRETERPSHADSGSGQGRPGDPEWCLAPGLELPARELGDRVAIFNEETADTHLLEPWAAAILERLRRGPATGAALRAELGTETDGEAVTRALGEFRYLGLIEPAAPCS